MLVLVTVIVRLWHCVGARLPAWPTGETICILMISPWMMSHLKVILCQLF